MLETLLVEKTREILHVSHLEKQMSVSTIYGSVFVMLDRLWQF